MKWNKEMILELTKEIVEKLEPYVDKDYVPSAPIEDTIKTFIVRKIYEKQIDIL